MDTLSKHELGTLLQAQGNVCISLFAPTHPTGLETRQDPIRLRNLLRDTEAQLLARRLRFPDVKRLLEPAYALLEDSYFWRHQSDGLAMFLDPELLRYYHLPLQFEELVVIAPHFHFRPLLPLVGTDHRFYILALTQNTARLFAGTGHGLDEVAFKSVFANLNEALHYDAPERHLSSRTAGAVPAGGGRPAVMFYSSGGNADDVKERLAQYFHQVDDDLHHQLGDERAPIILAGVDYVLPIYRGASKLSHLVDEVIAGSPQEMSAKELHRQAWAALRPHFQKRQAEAVAQYRQLAGSQRASHNLQAIVRAAYQGRVSALFVATIPPIWGVFDPEADVVYQRRGQPRANDEDLLNVAATHALLNSGDAYALAPGDMPDEAQVAAVFRY